MAALAGCAGRARRAVAADHRSPASPSISSRPPSAFQLQRRAGTQNRVDLAYLWPSLVPPDPAIKIVDGAPVDPNERLFVTIQVSDGTMPLSERVQTIYPRYLGR